MKKIILFIFTALCFLFTSIGVFASDIDSSFNVSFGSNKIYDCSNTGKCIEKNNQGNAFYVDSLSPGVNTFQQWKLINDSQQICRAYLRLRSKDNSSSLSEKIYLSAVSRVDGVEQKILDKTKFSKLISEQSIYLGKIPSGSSAEIDWNILLDIKVDNRYQDLEKNFSAVLYSYCLGEDRGRVAGVSTNNKKEIIEKLAYSILSLSSLGILVWFKYKDKA